MANTNMSYRMSVYHIASKIQQQQQIDTTTKNVIEIVDSYGHILDEKAIETIAMNMSICFPSDKSPSTHNSKNSHPDDINRSEYYVSLLDFLTNEYYHIDQDESEEEHDDADVFEGLFGKRFRKVKSVDPIKNLKYCYELVVCYGSDDSILASCLVHKQKIFGTYEIHEVCVSKKGQKICSNFIPMVFNYYINDIECKEVRIYCETKNGGACSCYNKIPGVELVKTEHTIGFIYRKPLTSNSNESNKRQKSYGGLHLRRSIQSLRTGELLS